MVRFSRSFAAARAAGMSANLLYLISNVFRRARYGPTGSACSFSGLDSLAICALCNCKLVRPLHRTIPRGKCIFSHVMPLSLNADKEGKDASHRSWLVLGTCNLSKHRSFSAGSCSGAKDSEQQFNFRDCSAVRPLIPAGGGKGWSISTP